MQEKRNTNTMVSDANGATSGGGASPTPLIDLERVQEVIDLICEGEHAALGRWIDHLETDLGKFGVLLPSAGTSDGDHNIQIAAHSIRGTCLNMGAQALGELFSALEQDAKENKSARLTQRYAENRELEKRSIAALRVIAAQRNLAP
jgi:HPt (histidine-containing phosphotransfer) domain-containing protein